MPNKWDEFRNDKKYKLVDLGREAVFFIPLKKLGQKINGKNAEALLSELLCEKGFSSLSFTNIPRVAYAGLWKNPKGKIIKDKCRIYLVSFPGKERIPLLLELLAQFAKMIQEECIYFKAGQYSCLVYPPTSKRKKKLNSFKRQRLLLKNSNFKKRPLGRLIFTIRTIRKCKNLKN